MRNIIHISFLLVLLIAGIKLENFLNVADDYRYYPDQVNTELIISEQATEELSSTHNGSNYENITDYDCETGDLYSFKIAIYSYNCLTFLRFKTIISNRIIHSNIISILHKSNIWHKSPEEEPRISC